jgi:sugar ABC transporter, permease protein
MSALRYIKKNAMAYLFLLPFVLLFTLFVILPVLYAIFLSLTNYNMLENPGFVGITNYKLLILDDDEFIIALKNTFVFSCISGPISFFASFFMAWIINQVKCRNLFSLAFYAPSITSGVAISVVWLYFFSADRYGLVNNFLYNLGLISEPIKWNLDASTILPVIIFISIWMGMGTGFLTFLAGFQTVDKEMYEAAAIDGIKNRFQELFYITFPQMKPQLLFGAINAIVGSFGVFDIAVSFAGMPSPNYAAHTLVAHLYDYAFTRFEMGYASAIAVILFAITFLLGRLVTRIFASD